MDSIIKKEGIENFIKEGELDIEKLTKSLENQRPVTKILNFKHFAQKLIEEIKNNPDVLEENPYFQAIYEGVEKRAYNDEIPEIRQEAQDTLNKIEGLLNN